ESALGKRELLGNTVQPGRPGHEVLGVRAADREPEVIVAVVDDAFADDAIAGTQSRDAAAHLGYLARPLVARDDRIRDGNDVAALVELEVRVADADVARAHEHLVRRDRRHVELADSGASGLLEYERFHAGRLLIVRSGP